MRRSRATGIMLLAVWCVGMVTDVSRADVSADEVQKIENAMPTKVVVKPAKPRKRQRMPRSRRPRLR